MALSLEDVDELSTDSDDEEYIPKGFAGLSSEGSDDNDSDAAQSEDVKSAGGAAKLRKRPSGARKRKAKSGAEEARPSEGEVEEQEEKKAKEKARIDQLWASFKQDTAVPLHKPPENKGKDSIAESTPPKRMKIQKTYDFAGEEIVVEKEVFADSKEAKQYLQTHAESAQVATQSEPSISVAESLISRVADTGTQSQGVPTPQTSSVALQARGTTHAKRGSGLGDVLKSLGKKNKMSTLEKSCMDWDQYKHKHDLEEELARNTKDGYLAKQEFLQWSDQKQFELERNERLKRLKKLH